MRIMLQQELQGETSFLANFQNSSPECIQSDEDT